MKNKEPLEWYSLPSGPYSDRFLKCLAAAVHYKKTNPSELSWFFNEGWSQDKIALELWNRVKK